MRARPADVPYQAQQQGGAPTHALLLLQFLRRGLQYALQGAKALQQAVGRLVGILTWDGVEQRQLQQLVVRQGVGPQLAIPVLRPLPVSVVQSHGCPSLRCGFRCIFSNNIVYHDMTDVTSGISLAVFCNFPAVGISPLNLRRVYGIMSGSQAGVMELVDVVDSKSTAGDSVPVRVRSPAP